MIRNYVVGGISAVLLSACATVDDGVEPVDESAKAILDAHERTGEQTNCIGLRRIQQIKPVTETVFLVRDGVSSWYVADMSSRCAGATRQSSRLEYSTSLSQLCTNDIIRVVDNQAGFAVGSCSVATFERLEKIEEQADE